MPDIEKPGLGMPKGRMEAFTDGVVAIIITIMVLELKVPAGHDVAALAVTLPVFFAYVLSYINIGLYWNNHHHLMQAVERVNGRALWANLFLLFWMSLIPFVIHWMDESDFYPPLPTAAYGVVMVMSAVGYFRLQKEIIACNGGPDSVLAAAIGKDRKGNLSLALYLLAIPSAFVSPWLAIALYVAVAAIWFIPDRRIEKFGQG